MSIKLNKPYMTELSTEAWLEQRKNFITATEASALMGVNPYITPTKLLREKPLPPLKLESEYLDRGLEHEDNVLQEALKWLDAKLLDSQGFYANPETRISATPDGITSDGRMIEIKCTGAHNLDKWEHPPIYYIMQCQVQMYVTGAVENYLMARFFYGWPHKNCEPAADKMWKITYDPDIIKILVDKVREFWYALKEDKKIRLNSKESKLHELMLKATCSEYKGNIIMQKFEMDPRQLKIVRQTCVKAAAKMLKKANKLGDNVTDLAEEIETKIFKGIAEKCGNGGREFLIQIGAAVNGLVDAREHEGNLDEMYILVIEALKYIEKQ